MDSVIEHVYPEEVGVVKRGQKPKPISYVIFNDCWICVSHADNGHGYPCIKRNGRQCRLNRYVYECEHGAIPEGLVVMHTCDNRDCINPEHLKAGTYSDNSQDMHNKGRGVGRKGKTHSAEQRARISEGRKKYWREKRNDISN